MRTAHEIHCFMSINTYIGMQEDYCITPVNELNSQTVLPVIAFNIMASENMYKNLCIQILLLGKFSSLVMSKIYDPCELAKEMVTKHRFPKDDIANWICLIKHESDFDTSVIGRLNSDGSLDHGLFQISDLFWCNHDGIDGACGVNCEDLRNDDIKDDSICARRIYRVTKHKTGNGFNAWAGWTQHCRQNNVQQYIANCTALFL